MKSTDTEFYFFDDEDTIAKVDKMRNTLFSLFKCSIVCGPSFVFTRYHEANKTEIGGLNKTCGKILDVMPMLNIYGLSVK